MGNYNFLKMFVDVFEACVAAAREDNAAVLNQLQSELKSVVDDIQSMEEKQQIFELENAVLL